MQGLTNKALMREIRSQARWLAEHGGCEAAYIARYGNPGMDHCYGDGGTAIYKADRDALDRLLRIARKRGL